MNEEQLNTDNEILNFHRYFSFWPYFLIMCVILLVSSYFYLRYTNYIYESRSKIEIIDKAHDDDMALPTAMTIFNRSMINLENETGVLNSFNIHNKVVTKLNSNVKYFTEGTIKTSENTLEEWQDNAFSFEIKINPDTISVSSSYLISFRKDKIYIVAKDNNGETFDEFTFEGLTTANMNHNLPFEMTRKSTNEIDDKLLKFYTPEVITEEFRNKVLVSQNGQESDQLDIVLKHSNYNISNQYLNTLMSEFDNDGISDRRLVYKRTMDFVDSRFSFLSDELELIENRKQEFKELNKLNNIEFDGTINANQQLLYDSELFEALSQFDLAELLEQTIYTENYDLMPSNIGLENLIINELINQYNLIITERSTYLLDAGENNSYIKNYNRQIDALRINIKNSIINYKNSLNITIAKLQAKEREYEEIYDNLPQNEKMLRSIERELEIKESLFLLLLQKREEAAINYAVIKPSIKIIDYARNSILPVSPNKKIIYGSALILGILIPLILLYIKFSFDTKFHVKNNITELIPDIPVVGEIPHINDENLNTLLELSSKNFLIESFRMLVANINFTMFNLDKKRGNVFLVTSSIKGEGKTIISSNFANILNSRGNKTILIGADLRNPQLHKLMNVPKSTPGLTNYIFDKNSKVEDFILEHKVDKSNTIDVILSGIIPPNPTEILGSDKFKNLIEELKNRYDNIVIDSAPCVLVSDTFEISNLVDSTIYVIRANFSDKSLAGYISDLNKYNKLTNMCIVLNALGKSAAYGYKYGYQYGYGYTYNYGYGYGYTEEN